jgi:hypothetical protein
MRASSISGKWSETGIGTGQVRYAERETGIARDFNPGKDARRASTGFACQLRK